jgi:hypothetical protein
VSSRLFSSDPITKRRTIWHDLPDGGVAIETQQDATDVVTINKEIQKDDVGYHGRDIVRVASIPTALYFDLKAKGIIEDPRQDPKQKKFLRWLDDPENRYFRTNLGKLSRTSS